MHVFFYFVLIGFNRFKNSRLKSEVIKRKQLADEKLLLEEQLKTLTQTTKKYQLPLRDVLKYGTYRSKQHGTMFHYQDILYITSKNAKRNNVVGRLVQSVNYAPMTVEMRLPPTYTRVAHDSLYAIEGRGLWRMEDPIQGGTFVSLTVVDEENGRVVTVDGYVYSPQFDKRPLLLEIEALIYSLRL